MSSIVVLTSCLPSNTIPSQRFLLLRPKPLLSSSFPRPRRRAGLPWISAALRPRRNPLREKLLAKEAQVRRTPDPPDDPHDAIEIHRAADSVPGTRLDNWVEQYKADNHLWGVGTGPIFTVVRDQAGNVTRVSVDEDEIVRRNWSGADAKISRAKVVAEEILSGEYVVPPNSSVVKFVEEGKETGFSDRIRPVILRAERLMKISPRLGLAGLCGYAVFWVTKSLWSVGERGELTSEEKEMVSRKVKAREQREMAVKGSVEVIGDNDLLLKGPVRRPGLDWDELRKDLAKAKVPGDIASGPSLLGRLPDHVDSFEHKVNEIRQMARKARESERKGQQDSNQNEEVELQLENNDMHAVTTSLAAEAPVDAQEFAVEAEKPSLKAGVDVNEKGTVELNAPSFREEAGDAFMSDILSSSENLVHSKPKIIRSVKEAREFLARKNRRPIEVLSLHKSSHNNLVPGFSGPGGKFDESSAVISDDVNKSNALDMNNLYISGEAEVVKMCTEFEENRLIGTSHIGKSRQSWESPSSSESGNPLIASHEDITYDDTHAVEETSLSQKPHTLADVQIEDLDVYSEVPENNKTKGVHDEEMDNKYDLPSTAGFTENTYLGRDDSGISSHFPLNMNGIPEKSRMMQGVNDMNVLEGGNEGTFESVKNHDKFSGEETSGHFPDNGDNISEAKEHARRNWLEENFHEFEPIVQKIGEGFRENYAVAKERTKEQNMLNVHISELDLVDGNDEIEWMKDEKLKEIVFKVRENELNGKDPFHLMSVDDQQAFFVGLEKKAENMNTKLSTLHEWIHSRVENIDYGADGISLYDSPDKIIPRWKGPSVDAYPEFLTNSVHNRQVTSKEEEKNRIGRSKGEELKSSSDGVSTFSSLDGVKRKPVNGTHTSSPTLVECSDGSSRAGKKGGKEQWEHTKKWTREFLEIYNAETDPEVKSAMKDMGKDLDKWITNKEIKDVGNLMTRIPKKKRRFIQKKIDKLKREMETFGPQAVVSKYREYSEYKEDHLWWLDLKFVLCIELYTVENDCQKVGFYSLEMAPDLELDPKQFHVIAFEDPGDSKNFCYIMQAHLEMLGNGSAFVVPRPSKDAFREAKANGFHVTVIRSGELKLNIDQRLEEIEEEIVEIGSKIYHDKIMQERSVDMGALMKGLLSSERSMKR